MLKITRNGFELPYKSFNFPAGEVGFKLDLQKHYIAWIAKTSFFKPAPYQVITARLKSSNDIIELAMAIDALKRIDKTPIRLFAPYLPYGRQDRVCDLGESFSLKVFADYINFLGFDEVITVDPHSNVTLALFNNLKVITQFDIIAKHYSVFRDRVFKGGIFVSPDAGAAKKSGEVAAFFGHGECVRADKIRDLSNGKIKETIVYCEDFKGKDVFCIDDCCDGGATFIELAKVCKAKNCGKFVLYASHGIFSKGVDNLLNNGIDEVYTTDSFYVGNDARLSVLPLNEEIGI